MPKTTQPPPARALLRLSCPPAPGPPERRIEPLRVDQWAVGYNLWAMRTLNGLVFATVLLAGGAYAQEQRPIITTGISSYTLRPGDVLRINVWGQEDFSGQFQIDEEGRILYPVLGEIDTRNLTIGQLRDTVRAGLETLFTSPFLTITPLFRISVLGYVTSPGLYTVDPTLTPIDVVALAGGPSRGGNLNDIRVLRSGGTASLSFEQESIRGRTLQEVGVRSGDQVFVPRSTFTREDAVLLLQIAQVALTIAIFVNTM